MPQAEKRPLMIVEDDAITRILLETAAKRSGVFEPVTVAVDGRAALESLASRDPSHLPALIATDLSMPHMSGLELLRELKRDSHLRSIPVAIITSSDLAADREQTLAEGACAFVTKPCGVDAMIAVFTALRVSCVEIVDADRDS